MTDTGTSDPKDERNPEGHNSEFGLDPGFSQRDIEEMDRLAEGEG